MKSASCLKPQGNQHKSQIAIPYSPSYTGHLRPLLIRVEKQSASALPVPSFASFSAFSTVETTIRYVV